MEYWNQFGYCLCLPGLAEGRVCDGNEGYVSNRFLWHSFLVLTTCRPDGFGTFVWWPPFGMRRAYSSFGTTCRPDRFVEGCARFPAPLPSPPRPAPSLLRLMFIRLRQIKNRLRLPSLLGMGPLQTRCTTPPH